MLTEKVKTQERDTEGGMKVFNVCVSMPSLYFSPNDTWKTKKLIRKVEIAKNRNHIAKINSLMDEGRRLDIEYVMHIVFKR